MSDQFDPAIGDRGEGADEAVRQKSEPLKGMDLTVPAGSIFGFLGENGSGKSTAMNIMARVNQPGGGEVRIFGLDVRKNGVATR